MSVRPYPSQARALRQIMRRHRNELPAALQRDPRPTGGRVSATLAAQPGAGDYVLSARGSQR